MFTGMTIILCGVVAIALGALVLLVPDVLEKDQ